MLSLELMSPGEIAAEVARRARARRLALGFTQQAAAERAGMSLGSLKRFERTGAIAFESLVRLAVALDAVDGLRPLFEPPPARTLDEVLAASAPEPRQRGWRK